MTDSSKLSRPTFDYSVESEKSKLARKSKESPFFVVGITGCVLVCLYGAYRYKTRGTMTTSMYLMQLRVAAQGTVVAACTAGVMNQLYHRLIDPKSMEDSH